MSLISDADTLLQKRKRHKLPEQAYVTLSQALSWLAFGVPLKSEALVTALEFGSSDKIGDARLRLREAVDRLADAASGGWVGMQGKFISHGFDDGGAKTQPIPPQAFHDFARFDASSDGLNLGHGLAWRYSPDGLDTAENDRPEEAYRSVMVHCRELCEFSDKRDRAPSYKRGRPPSDEDILIKADEMKGRGMNGYEIASLMHKEQGFEHVSTTRVRELINGKYPRGKGKWKPAQ